MIDRILERLKKAKEIGNSCIGCDYKENCIPSNCEKRAFDLCTEIVQEVAKEYGKHTNVRSNGWIPCSERLPQEDETETALCEIANITLKNGEVTVGWCNRFIEKWYVVDEHCDYPIPYKYEDVIAWQPLPTPYQKGE